jgi:hypothetical protein
MDRDDRSTDTGMLGSDAESPGPGRDTRQTDLDPAETSSEHPTRTVGMSGSDPQRTRLGTQETSGRPLAGAPQDTTASGQADTGMVGSETENPGPGRDTRRTDPAATVGAEDPEATAAMSDTDLGRRAQVPRVRVGHQHAGHRRRGACGRGGLSVGQVVRSRSKNKR